MNKTIIVQGRVTEWVQENIHNLRNLTDARIIFSTWKDQPIKELARDGVEILLLDDPGPGPVQNFNRQIFGLQKAMDICEDGLILKTRSDMVHNIDPFSLWQKDKIQDSKFKLFEHKVFISNIMSIDSYKIIPGEGYRFFSPSDWILLGEKRDIGAWVDVNGTSKLISNLLTDYHYCCEQLWCLSNIIKLPSIFKMIDVENLKKSETNQHISACFIENNFKVLNTISTFKATCGRYSHQPEDLSFYIQEKK